MNKVHTYNLYHHFGDVFNPLYSEMPQNLTVIHPSTLVAGATSFTVSANDSSIIALNVNGEIIGVAVGTGNPVTISIPPQTAGNNMIVTVTKQNYYRYQATVPIISSSISENINLNSQFFTTLDIPNPNPAINSAKISFSLANSQNVTLKIYDVSGNLIKTLIDSYLEQGRYNYFWYGTDNQGHIVSEGIYFYTLETPNQRLTKKLLLAR